MNPDLQDIPAIENHDPLRRFIRSRLHLGPITFAVLVLVLDLIMDAAVAWHFDIFFKPKGASSPGLLQDWTALAVDFVSIPLVCGIYLWLPDGATALFKRLVASGVFADPNSITSSVERNRHLYANRAFFRVWVLVSAIYALSQIAAYQGWVPWLTAGGFIDLQPDISYVRAAFWFLNWYTLGFGVFNVAITALTLRDLFRRSPNLHVLIYHPDKCGGLASISQYTTKIGWAIASIGLVLSAATLYQIRHHSLEDAYPIIAGIVAYAVVAPVAFFWPLDTAHDAMARAKHEQLLALAHQIDGLYDEVEAALAANKPGYEDEVKRLDLTKSFYATVEKFPIWPFDGTNLRRFFATVTAPVLPAIVSIVIQLVKKNLSLG